jgi:hypothetical protein
MEKARSERFIFKKAFRILFREKKERDEDWDENNRELLQLKEKIAYLEKEKEFLEQEREQVKKERKEEKIKMDGKTNLLQKQLDDYVSKFVLFLFLPF